MAIPTTRELAEAAVLFNCPVESLVFIRESVNTLYKFEENDETFFLRLAPRKDRNPGMVGSELALMGFLGRKGAGVPEVKASVYGNLVEEVGAADTGFIASVLKEAPGVHPEGAFLTLDHIHGYGRSLGALHKMAEGYAPTGQVCDRPHWHELAVFQLLDHIPEDQTLVRAACREVLSELDALPRGAGYGIIHADPEPWNILVHEGQWVYIDFDEACYHWYAFDIAVALMYILWDAADKESPGFPQQAWEAFITGYQAEHPLDEFWLSKMPLFINLRVLEDYAFYCSRDPDRRPDWMAAEMDKLRKVIELREPLFSIRFTKDHTNE